MTSSLESLSTVEDPAADVAPAPKRSRSGLVLASVLAFGTAAEVWVKRQMLSTPEWVKVSDKILAEPKVQAALATYIVNQVYSSVDVQQQLADQLPDNLKGLAGPISGAIRGPATSAVESLLGTSQVQKLWHTANEKAHAARVRGLEDQTRIGSTANGTVTIDLGELVRVVGTDLGIPKSAMDKIPADVGQITLVHSDQLAAAQNAVKLIKWMGPLLTVLIIAMYALAVWLARGRRRRALRNIGWALVMVGLAILATRRLSGNFVSSLVSNPDNGPAVTAVFSIATVMLHDLAWTIATWGLVIAVGMIIIGPWRPALVLRRFLAPAINSEPAVFWVGAAVAYVLVLLWSPSPALRPWWSVIALGALLAVGLEVLRRRTAREFPDAKMGVATAGLRSKVSEVWTGIAGWVRGLGDGHGTGSSGDDDVSRLERLKALHDSGALDDGEYTAAKQRVLA
jgi:hypothetical protein